jgi:putative FmdB family regulatory protein
MPNYEYQCPKCNHRFEILHLKVTNEKETCPNCGAVAEKLISQSSFIIKGFSYANGYSKKTRG